MKGMQKIKRGTGFTGVIAYAMENGRGQVIGGNMSSDTPEQLAREFRAVRALRPDIEKAVWHNSLRLPEGDSLTPEQWEVIADDYMQRMGFTEQHPRAYVMHDDPEGQHIHIIASRIAIDGQVYLGQQENLESTRIISELEHDHSLTITKGRDYESDGQQRKPSKNEIEQAIRTGEAPPKLRLQAAIDTAIEGGAELPVFIERLESSGADVALNVSPTTGRISGVSYKLDGVAFKGSSLGKSYAWAGLERRGLIYDQVQHRDTAQRHSQNRGLYGKERAGVEHGHEQRDRHDSEHQAATATDAAARTSARADRAEHRAVSASAGSVERRDAARDKSATQERSRSNRSNESGDQREQRRDEKSRERSTASPQADQQQRHDDYAQAVDRMAGSHSYNDGGAYSRIADLSQASTGRASDSVRSVSGADRSTAAATAHAAAIGAATIEIGIRDATSGKMMRRMVEAGDLEKFMPWLKRMNAQGNDIYIRPAGKDHGVVLVDDLDRRNLERLKSEVGAVAITETSPGNFQAWVKLTDRMDTDTRREAARFIAERYAADMNSADGQHYGRLAGFTNRKPQHERHGRSPFVLAHAPALGLKAGRDRVLSAAQERIEHARIERESAERRAAIEQGRGVYEDRAEHWYKRAAAAAYDKYGQDADVSRIDYYAAKIMAIERYKPEVIAQTIATFSPDIEQRKAGHVEDYARRTAYKAWDDPAVHRAQRDEQRRIDENSRSYGHER